VVLAGTALVGWSLRRLAAEAERLESARLTWHLIEQARAELAAATADL
jgi:hypothetical protein